MKKYEVIYSTPKTSHSTEHTRTHRVEANSIAEAQKKSIEHHIETGELKLVGFDTLDSFGGLDIDYYQKEDYSDKEFAAKLESLITSVRVVE